MGKLQLGYSPLSENIYLGRTNPKKPNEWIGEKRDVTSNFIQVMLQKFEPNTINNITINGETKFRVLVTEVKNKIEVNGKLV